MLDQLHPELEELLETIGEAGQRLADMHASEGATGNISLYIGWPVEVRRRFPVAELTALPQPVPELAGHSFIVTGSGRRLRDIHQDPGASLGVMVVGGDGSSATLYTAHNRCFASVTSEFNSHLAVHHDQVLQSGTNFHAVVHAQPLHLTYISHIPRYRDSQTLNHALLRWQPETIVNLPEGIGVLPFLLHGSPQLMQVTVEGLRQHRVVLWSKHGVMARSDVSVLRPTDRIEYAETAARYEYHDLTSGAGGEGLSAEELRSIAANFGVEQRMF